MSIVYTSAKETLRLGEELARGGEGVVYTIVDRPDQLAKIYLQTPHGGYEQKLTWMKNNPPDDPSRSKGHASIAWPLDLLYDEKEAFIGYVMPLIKDGVPILEVFNPYSRKTTYPEFTTKYLYRTAHNLASAIAALHARDYIIGDLNERNILVTSSAMVTVIDTDSFQVREHRHERIVVYPCPVGKPEYMPPELQGWGLTNEVRRPEHDDFTLAVMIFQLLMEGSHPFRSRWLGQDDPPPIEKKIQLGYFPYDKTKQRWVAPPPNIPDLKILPPTLAAMFLRCFSEGLQDVRLRPSPSEWARALHEAEEALQRCPEGHEYGGHYRTCPYCVEDTGSDLGWVAAITGFPGLAWKRLSSAFVGAAHGMAGLFKRVSTQKYIIVTAAVLVILIGLGAVLVPIWQRSVAERAFKIITSVPIGYGTNKQTTPLLPMDNPANPGETEKNPAGDKKTTETNKDGQTPGDDKKNPAEKQIPDKDKNTKDPDKDQAGKNDQDKKNPKDKSSKDKNSKDKNPKSKDKETVQQNTGNPKTSGNVTGIISSERNNSVKSNSIEPSNVNDIVLLRALLKDPHYIITSIAYSPSGNSLAAGISDGSVRVWHVHDGTNTLMLKGHTRKVNAVAYSPDGSLIASASDDMNVRLWRTNDGAEVMTLTGHQDPITGLAFSHDGQYLATGSKDNTVKIWKVKDGTEWMTLKGNTMDITCVAFSPGDSMIVAGSKDNTIHLWRLSDGKPISVINAHAGDVYSVKFSPSGGFLASGSMDFSIRFWNYRDSSLQRKLVGHLRAVNSISFSPNGELLASASDDGTVKIWRVSNGELLRTIQNNVTAVRCVAFSPDGSTLSAGLDNGTINIWDIAEK